VFDNHFRMLNALDGCMPISQQQNSFGINGKLKKVLLLYVQNTQMQCITKYATESCATSQLIEFYISLDK